MTDSAALLEAIDTEAYAWTFQTFDDSPDKRPELAATRHGTLEDLAPWLASQNAQGAGIFFTVNQTDGQGRKAENIQRVRAVFADFDTAVPGRLDLLMADRLPPSIVVESSPAKHHAYWLVDDLPMGEFKAIQQRIAADLSSDPTVSDLSRVMRLPDFNHMKGEPHPVKLLHCDPGQLYTRAQILDRWPAPEPIHRPPAPPATRGNRYASAALGSAHSAVSVAPEGTRNTTLNREAFSIAQLAAGGVINAHEAVATMADAGRSAGLSQYEIEATLKSAFSAGGQHPRGVPERLPRQRASQPVDPREPHPLTQFIDLDMTPRPPRWILPGLVAEGVALFAGWRGVGKTTALLPLALAAAGLHEDGYPLAPLHWRHLCYVTEDAAQAMRIISGFAQDAGLDAATIRERLHLVEAKRLHPGYLVQAGEELAGQYTRTVQGVEIPPLVVLDTLAATIELESENDNAEASKAIAAIKQDFAGLPVWLVAHIAKTSANATSLKEITTRGAGAFEGDAHQTLYLVEDQGTRYLLTGKTRFEPRWHELQLEPGTKQIMAENVFGGMEPLTLRWAIARPMEGATRREQAEAAQEARRKEEAAQLRDDVRNAVQAAWQAGNPISRNAVAAKVKRQKAAVVACIESLLAERWLLEIEVPRKLRVNANKARFLINLNAREHEAVIAGQPAPESKTAIPPSWRSDVPEITTDAGTDGQREAA